MKSVAYMTHARFSMDSGDLASQFAPDQNCLYQSLPDEMGVGYSAMFRLAHDLSYIDTRYTPSKDLGILSRMDCHEPRLVITLSLKGHSRFQAENGNVFCFDEGYTTITSFNSSSGERQYQADKAIVQLRLSIGKNWLEQYCDKAKLACLFAGNTRLISHHPMSSVGTQSARQLLDINIAPDFRALFIQGQFMTILASELTPIFDVNLGQSTRLNQKDKAMANRARDILLSEYKNPPSIAELAKRVGTNQFKLKYLFHALFANTPYGLLADYRMQQAYRLLQTSDLQISAVAESVGYQHASNFSSAFTKHFGLSPKVVRKP